MNNREKIKNKILNDFNMMLMNGAKVSFDKNNWIISDNERDWNFEIAEKILKSEELKEFFEHIVKQCEYILSKFDFYESFDEKNYQSLDLREKENIIICKDKIERYINEKSTIDMFDILRMNDALESEYFFSPSKVFDNKTRDFIYKNPVFYIFTENFKKIRNDEYISKEEFDVLTSNIDSKKFKNHKINYELSENLLDNLLEKIEFSYDQNRKSKLNSQKKNHFIENKNIIKNHIKESFSYLLNYKDLGVNYLKCERILWLDLFESLLLSKNNRKQYLSYIMNDLNKRVYSTTGNSGQNIKKISADNLMAINEKIKEIIDSNSFKDEYKKDFEDFTNELEQKDYSSLEYIVTMENLFCSIINKPVNIDLKNVLTKHIEALPIKELNNLLESEIIRVLKEKDKLNNSFRLIEKKTIQELMNKRKEILSNINKEIFLNNENNIVIEVKNNEIVFDINKLLSICMEKRNNNFRKIIEEETKDIYLVEEDEKSNIVKLRFYNLSFSLKDLKEEEIKKILLVSIDTMTKKKDSITLNALLREIELNKILNEKKQTATHKLKI